MSTSITTINASDLITNSRAVINANFSSLNSNKAELSNNLSDLTVPNTALNNILPTQSGNGGKVLGTDGSNTSWVDPSGAVHATTVVEGIVFMSTSPASSTHPIAVSDNDPRVPTQAENDALAGTGTPSGSNKFVTADTDALKELLSNKDTDGTLAANSDTKYPSQKAIKTYVDAIKPSKTIGVRTSQQALGTNPSETDVIANISVPGGSLSSGRSIRVEAYFTFVMNTGTATWKVYYGGSAVGTISYTGPANNNTYNGHIVFTIAYVGASSQYISGVALAVDNAASAAASAVSGIVSATSAVDESAAQNVKLTYGAPANAVTNTIQGATIQLI